MVREMSRGAGNTRQVKKLCRFAQRVGDEFGYAARCAEQLCCSGSAPMFIAAPPPSSAAEPR